MANSSARTEGKNIIGGNPGHGNRKVIMPLQTGYQAYGRCGLVVGDWFRHIGMCADDLAIVRSLVGIGFACTLLASVLSVRDLVPAALQATGQALYQSVSYGLAIAIAALIGGIIYGELGAAPLFFLSAAIMFGAIPIAWRVLR